MMDDLDARMNGVPPGPRIHHLERNVDHIRNTVLALNSRVNSLVKKVGHFHGDCFCYHTQSSQREVHVTSLPNGLIDLRRDDQLTDVILEVEGKAIPCHRVVLAAAIPYFRAMFTSCNMQESNKKRVVLQDLSFEVVEKVIDYAYGVEVIPHSRGLDKILEKWGPACAKNSNISELFHKLAPSELAEENKPTAEEILSVLNILHVANMFQMTDLEDNCCTYLKNYVSLESAIDIFYFCKIHGEAFVALEAKVTNWIAKNFQSVAKQAAFMDIGVAEFLMLISSPAMYVDDEFSVLLAIISWVAHDEENRRPHLKQLLAQTHLHQISAIDMSAALEHPVIQAAADDIRTFLRAHGATSLDSPPHSEPGTLSTPHLPSAPSRALARHVLVFGRKFYAEDTVEDHNFLCIDVDTGGIHAFPAPPGAFYGTQLGVSVTNHEVVLHAISRSELHALVLNRFKRVENTWEVTPINHLKNVGKTTSGSIIESFCRSPVIASTDGTKPFNFLMVSMHGDVDLSERRQRVRSQRKPYNAIFFWEGEGEEPQDGTFGTLQHCFISSSWPTVPNGDNSGYPYPVDDMNRFLRHARRRDPNVVEGISEPVLIFTRDRLYILDRDVGFYCFQVHFKPDVTPSLANFSLALDQDHNTFKQEAASFFPSRQISGIPCDKFIYFISRIGAITRGQGHSGDIYAPPKVICYDTESREWQELDTPLCPHPASTQLFCLKGKVHLFFVQNKPTGRRVAFGWYVLDPITREWLPQKSLPALRNYFMHTMESNCVALTLPSHILKDGAFLCDKKKNGWYLASGHGDADVSYDGAAAATTTEDDDADDEEDVEVYQAFQQAMQNQAVDDENADADFDAGGEESSSSEEEFDESDEEEDDDDDDEDDEEDLDNGNDDDDDEA